MLFIHEYQHSNRRCTSRGPTLRFNQDTTIAIAGKFENATLNGKVFDSFFEPVSISAGDVLKMGTVTGSRRQSSIHGRCVEYVVFERGV